VTSFFSSSLFYYYYLLLLFSIVGIVVVVERKIKVKLKRESELNTSHAFLPKRDTKPMKQLN
jgi:hypothetical protein